MDKKPETNNDPDLEEDKAILGSFNEVCKCRAPGAAVFEMRRSYQEPQTGDMLNSFTLMGILSSVFIDGNADATQARDRIYGMLGMADDKADLGLVPNYNEAISDIRVYTDVARAMITAERIDLLSLSQHRPHLAKGQQEEQTFRRGYRIRADLSYVKVDTPPSPLPVTYLSKYLPRPIFQGKKSIF